MCEFYTNGAEGFSPAYAAPMATIITSRALTVRYARSARGARSSQSGRYRAAMRPRCRLTGAVTGSGAEIKFGLASRKVVKHLHSNGLSVLSNLSYPITNGFFYVANNLHAASASQRRPSFGTLCGRPCRRQFSQRESTYHLRNPASRSRARPGGPISPSYVTDGAPIGWRTRFTEPNRGHIDAFATARADSADYARAADPSVARRLISPHSRACDLGASNRPNGCRSRTRIILTMRRSAMRQSFSASDACGNVGHQQRFPGLWCVFAFGAATVDVGYEGQAVTIVAPEGTTSLRCWEKSKQWQKQSLASRLR